MPARPRIRPIFALLLTGVVFTGVVPASAATTDGGTAWTVQTVDNAHGTGRGNFTYDAEPGAVIDDVMRVVNTGTEPLPLAVYAADAFTTASGQIDVLMDGTPSENAGTWVSIEPGDLELAPSESADVGFRIAVPLDARPGDHAAGIVTSLVSTDPSESLTVDRRLGTRINIRVAGELRPAATVSAVRAAYTPSWNPFAPGILTLSYSLDNSGNTRLTGVEAVAIGGPFAAPAPAAQLPEVLPGSVIDVQREVPALSLGWLAGTVTIAPEGVGLGAGSVAAIVAEFSASAVPWSLYALLLIVAGIAVTAVLLVRRRAGSAPPPS